MGSRSSELTAFHMGRIIMAAENQGAPIEVAEAFRTVVRELVEGLRPFAEMAEGKDSWAPDTRGCAQFPKLFHVRNARRLVRLYGVG